MPYYPFDSRNNLYRSKIGAVAAEETLRLRLLLHNDAQCNSAYLLIKKDEQEEYSLINMAPAEFLDDYRFWECDITLDTGLYWYYFKYDSPYGQMTVTKCKHSLGFVSDEGTSWQQTVYEKEYKTPDWLKGGIIYQIFPDRFYNSGTTKTDVPTDRYLSHWEKQPEYRQNNGVCSLGNDYYGGDLKGISEKLPYLYELGVSCIYLNPIFEAHSNHRYNTANYLKIDSLLGNEDDLKNLCAEAKKFGIAVILDGVFSHTGDDSIYFNRLGRYDSVGAYNSQESKYKDWFKFKEWPNSYDSWWGITTLPETNELNSDFNEYITGKDGVIRYWMRCGVMGWRLDVADELPDSFIENIRTALKSENPDGYLLGEVWEDASNKTSYGYRRKFLCGKELDSVMNYPFANAIIDFLSDGDACKFVDTIAETTENYPTQSIQTLMNHIGTHDTPRILTRLGNNYQSTSNRAQQSTKFLNSEDYKKAINRVKLAVALQFTLPGVPSIFYGDEVGMQGYGDPFCRASFPWNNINNELLEFYKKLGKFRRGCSCLGGYEFYPVHSESGCVLFMRKDRTDAVLTAVNTNNYEIWAELPKEFKNNITAEFGNMPNSDGWIKIDPNSIGLYKSIL